MTAVVPRADRGFLIQQTYERIREDILNQRLRPGAKLTAEHLATTLNVSRTPIRQALERLYQEGYVTQIPARGFFVAEMAASEVRDLYDVRRALEVHALDTAFERGIAPEAVERLAQIDARYRRLVGDDTDMNRAEVDQEFHLALAALAGNAVVLKMLRDIFDRLNFRRRYDGYWYWDSRGLRGYEGAAEHQRLIDAITRGDRAAATRCLGEHLARAWVNYAEFLRKSTQGAAELG